MRIHLLFMLSLAVLLGATTAAARADALGAPTPAPVATGTISGMQYAKFGAGKPALVLVPGLACGMWVWNDLIAREAKHHTVYAVTLPGFDGVPAVANEGLDAADASIVALISSEKLDRPVLIGHSLGGFLALRIGTEHANLLRGDVSVDGLPVFPNVMRASADERNRYATQFAETVTHQTPQQYQAAQVQTNRDYVTDPAVADRITALTSRSEQAAVALYGQQLFAADLRPQLAKLTVPTLVIAPVPDVPLPTYIPPQMAQMPMEQRTSQTVGFYQSLFDGAPMLQVVPIAKSRHFVMFDQPDAFAQALDTFIATLK